MVSQKGMKHELAEVRERVGAGGRETTTKMNLHWKQDKEEVVMLKHGKGPEV